MNPSKLTCLAIAAILSIGCMTSIASAQDQTSFPMQLEASNLDALVKGRLLKSYVNETSLQSVIKTVRLSYNETAGNDPVELLVDMNYDKGVVKVMVDDELLAKIKGQPVVFELNQSPVTEVVLQYDAPVASDPMMMAADGKDVVFIRLSDTKRMAGKVEGLTEFKLTTSFGEVVIPMSEIAGIRFHTTSDDKAVIILNNGDALTGVPTVPAIELITDWGKADIEPQFIQSLTSTSTARFRQQNTDFGVRWTLNTGNSMAPGALGSRN